MSIASNLITTGAVDILTVGAGAKNFVTGILFCNFTATDETITVHARVAGAATSNTNTILKNFVLPAWNTYNFDFKLLLATTDVVTVTGTVGSIANATITYLVA